jgi:hypothetical protein
MKLISILYQGLFPLNPMTTLSKLEKIMVTRAIGSSALSSLTSEWSIDKIAIDLFNMQSNNTWVFSVILIYAYGYYKLLQMMKPQLVNIPIYYQWSRNIDSVLFVLFLVFTRDVQNAI